MDLPVYEIFVEDCEFLEIALVDSPAIERDFIYFKKEKIPIIFNDDKKIVTGLVMIPNQKIRRNDSLGERYVFYSEDTVATSAQLFLKNGMKFNEEHSDKHLKLDVIESFLTRENNDFEAPKGSWVVTAKINDDELWRAIKGSELKGFSFQSLFQNELTKTNFNKTKQELMNLKEKLQAAINAVLFSETKAEEFAEEVKQISVWEQTATNTSFEVGDIMTYDFDGETHNFGAGEYYVTSLDKNVVTDANGKIVVHKDKVVATEDPAKTEVKAEFAEVVIPLTKEEINTLISGAITAAVDIVMTDVDTKIEALKTELTEKVTKVDTKVEEFGNQEIPVKEDKEAVLTGRAALEARYSTKK